MNAAIESECNYGLSTAQGLSFAASCSICGIELTKQYYRVNGHDICSDCRAPVMSQLVRKHGSVVRAFLRGWLFGALSGASGYVVYAAAMSLLRGFDGLIALFIGPLVWKVTRWANPGCSNAYRMIAVSITYSSIVLSSLPDILKNLIEAGEISANTIGESWMSVLAWSIEWLFPLLQHPASFLVILLIGFGIGEVFRLRQHRASLVQGPFPIAR